jgi:hypothetical protein
MSRFSGDLLIFSPSSTRAQHPTAGAKAMPANTTHQSTCAMSALLGKILLILVMLLAVQIRPALSYTYGQPAPIFNNFMNQQQELCRQKQWIFMQGECFSPAAFCRMRPDACMPPDRTQLLPPGITCNDIVPGTDKALCKKAIPQSYSGIPEECHWESGPGEKSPACTQISQDEEQDLNALVLKAQCQKMHATLIGKNCVQPMQISLADCHLQGSDLTCFVYPRTEITPQGTVQAAPLMPPQGLEIKETGIESMLKPGILVLPSMCSQIGNEWDCQIPSSGQRIIIRAMPSSQ